MAMSKYNSEKITVDGETFHSKKEARRWQELRLLEKAGKIHDLRRQVPFTLIPTQYETYQRWSKKTGKRLKDGKRCLEQGCAYVADFVYYNGGEQIVEDAKGVRTADYIIKRKLMLFVHGIRIIET